MIKKEVLELKRRFKKDEATFTRLVGCYVNGEKNKIHTFGTKFLTLEDEEYYKYLDIANKTLSGKMGNNLLNLSFPVEEESVGGRQQILMALRETRLEDKDLLDRFYDLVIDTYDHAGNYLILLYHDAYDVIVRTKDNNKLDESEEVYEYLICAICPVALSKPGLGFLETEQRIGPRIRDWVVGVPDTAFLFPAFNDRSADIHSTLFYTKNTKEPHCEFMANGLGCEIQRTATEQKMAFHSIVRNVIGSEDEKTEDVLMDIQQKLNDMVEEYEDTHSNKEDILVLGADVIENALKECNVNPNNIRRIKDGIEDAFGDKMPEVEHVIDEKALEQNVLRMEKVELEHEVANLQKQLNNKQAEVDACTTGKSRDNILVYVPENKPIQVRAEMVNGKKCIIIPMEDENIIINGSEMVL